MPTLADLRFARQTIWKSLLVTVAAIASLALGVGANTTIFTPINTVFLEDLAVEDTKKVVIVHPYAVETRGGRPPLLARYIPSQRATVADPLKLLKYE